LGSTVPLASIRWPAKLGRAYFHRRTSLGEAHRRRRPPAMPPILVQRGCQDLIPRPSVVHAQLTQSGSTAGREWSAPFRGAVGSVPSTAEAAAPDRSVSGRSLSFALKRRLRRTLARATPIGRHGAIRGASMRA
jgi:hypothetical protein